MSVGFLYNLETGRNRIRWFFQKQAVKFGAVEFLSTHHSPSTIRDWAQHECHMEELLSSLIPRAHHTVSAVLGPTFDAEELVLLNCGAAGEDS